MKIQPLEPNDLSQLAALQPPDWQDITPHLKYYIESPHSHPIKVVEGNEITGIGTTVLNEDTAWLALIIVHPGHRNKGLGRMITEYLINSLDQSRYTTIYLVATPLGEPVYKKLGFVEETEFLFFRDGETDFAMSEFIWPVGEQYRDAVFAMDREVFGENRRHRIIENLRSAFVYRNENNAVEGYYLPAWGEGLVVAQNETAGLALMKLRLKLTLFPAIVPVDNQTAIRFLTENGHQQFRNAKRMRLGKARPWQPEKIYNRVSGQIG